VSDRAPQDEGDYTEQGVNSQIQSIVKREG
jgi:hypothetical protein